MAQSSPVRLATPTLPDQTEQTKDRAPTTAAHLAAGYRKETWKKAIAQKTKQTTPISMTMNKKTRDAMRCDEEIKKKKH